MKRGWYKRKQTSEVVFCEGDGFVSGVKHVFVRTRDRKIVALVSSVFHELYEPIKASGFPSLKPKEFKPRYAIYDHWSEGEAFVMEFEPGKFKVVMKDGREILRDEGTCKYFAKFFEDGSWKLIPEAEALARLDKPKPPVPAAEQFGPGTWYGGGLIYYSSVGDMFHVFKRCQVRSFNEHVGRVSYGVVRHIWGLGMISKERPKALLPSYQQAAVNSIVGRAAVVLDLPKGLGKPKKKKVLVEWAVSLGAEGPYVYELYPDWKTLTLPCSFKTGRTVEVPE